MDKNILLMVLLLVSCVENGLSQTLADNKEKARFYFEEVINNRKVDQLDKVYGDSLTTNKLMDGTAEKNEIGKLRKFWNTWE